MGISLPPEPSNLFAHLQNLLINGNIVKLTDFGISRILERIFTRTQVG